MDEWEADLDKLKTKVSEASADPQLGIDRQSRTEKGTAKLSDLAEAGEDARDSIKHGLKSAWEKLKQ